MDLNDSVSIDMLVSMRSGTLGAGIAGSDLKPDIAPATVAGAKLMPSSDYLLLSIIS